MKREQEGEKGEKGRGWLGDEGTSYISSTLAGVAGGMSTISYPSSPAFTFPRERRRPRGRGGGGRGRDATAVSTLQRKVRVSM